MKQNSLHLKLEQWSFPYKRSETMRGIKSAKRAKEVVAKRSDVKSAVWYGTYKPYSTYQQQEVIK